MRRVGIAAFENKQRSAQQFSDLSVSLNQQQSEELAYQLEVFRSSLAYFAVEHAKEIRSIPSFRAKFAQMCANMGVDILASSRDSGSGKGKSLWSNLIGKDVNEFYLEVAVKVIEQSKLTRDTNGGFLKVSEVKKRLAKSTPPLELNDNDIEQAVKSLRILGKGFDIIEIVDVPYIRSVQSELSTDQTSVLAACETKGFVTVMHLRDNLSWEPVRSVTVLSDMVAAGILWVDEQGIETEYWAPSWIEK